MLLSVSEFIGRFHPLLVHLPIGILLIALLLQWLSQKPRYAVAHGVLKLLWALGTAAALLSCITGYLLSVHDEYDETAVALHMWSGIAVAAVSLFLLLKVAARQYDLLYKTGAGILLLLIAVTGHFGGSLTHGSGYLSLTTLQSTGSDSGGIRPIANVQEALVYTDVVKPVLQAKCYSCHGPQKQKAGLRLDDSAYLLKGGEDGPVIVAGDAVNSTLVKSLLLPRNDEKHMPPKEKGQLTEGQIALLHWWVEQGAPFSKKVVELKQTEKLKPVLAALEHGVLKKLDVPMMPAEPVAPADTGAVNALKRRGVLVLPLAQNSNYLMTNFSTATGIRDTDISLLLPLKKQIVWLKLGGAAISDSALQAVAACTNLVTLSLGHTTVTDKGMGFLKSLKRLQTLNLVGTAVTPAGVLQLQSLRSITHLYLYQTGMTAAGLDGLKKAFPQAMIDTGGYTVPTLAGDTTEVRAAMK